MKSILLNKNLYLIFISIILILNIFINFDSLNFFFSDGLTYKKLALGLLENFEYIEENDLRSWRPPGYSFLLAIIFFLFGQDAVLPILILNNLFILASFFLLNNFLRLLEINNSETLIILSFIFFICLFKNLLIQNWSEMFYFFLICLFIFTFTSGYINNNYKLIIFSFLILGTSALIRTPSLIFGIFFWIIFFFKSSSILKQKLIWLFFFLFPTFLWVLRNIFILDYFPHTFTANYLNFFAGIEDYIDWEKINYLTKNQSNDVELTSILKKNILVSLQSNFNEFLFVRIKNILRYYYYSFTYIFSFLTLTSAMFYIFVFNFKNFIELNKILIFNLLFSNVYLFIISLAFYSPRFGYIPLTFINLFQICIIYECFKKIFKKNTLL